MRTEPPGTIIRSMSFPITAVMIYTAHDAFVAKKIECFKDRIYKFCFVIALPVLSIELMMTSLDTGGITGFMGNNTRLIGSFWLQIGRNGRPRSTHGRPRGRNGRRKLGRRSGSPSGANKRIIGRNWYASLHGFRDRVSKDHKVRYYPK